MSRPDLDRQRRQQALTAMLRDIRKIRDLSPQVVAREMRISVRAYQRFEAGDTPPDLLRLARFAEITDCDPAALFCLPLLDHPELALRCIDNKLFLIMLYALERLSLDLGEDLRGIEALSAITTVEAALERLGGEQRERSAEARRWLARKRPGESSSD